MPVIVEALSPILRAKFRDAIKKTDLFNVVAAQVWQKDGLVHCKPVGNGNTDQWQTVSLSAFDFIHFLL